MTFNARKAGAFTLVELLVVIAVIGVLVALLLPAVQAVRESSRRTACKNHLAQLAKGMTQHESQFRYFPTGGWSENWLGTPDRMTDAAQPGGWTFAVLPFIEEVALHDAVASSGAAQVAYQTLCETPVSLFNCPSRRDTGPVGEVNNQESGVQFRTSFQQGDATVTITNAVRADYAANGGSVGACEPPVSIPNPMTIADYLNLVGNGGAAHVDIIHHPPGQPHAATGCTHCIPMTVGVGALNGHKNHGHDVIAQSSIPSIPTVPCTTFMDAALYAPINLADGDEKRGWPKSKRITDLSGGSMPEQGGLPDRQDGLVVRMGTIRAGNVIDGLSNVYLVGEKYVRADAYEGGVDPADGSILYAGYSASNVRWADELPVMDTKDDHLSAFGSAHSGSWNVALGDGSVRSMNYDIDSKVHKNLAAKAPRFEGEVLGTF